MKISRIRTITRRTALKALLYTPAIVALAQAKAARLVGAQSADIPADFDPKQFGVVNLIVGGVDTRSLDQPENSDVLALATVDLVTYQVRAIWIPRDLWVEIPGFGYEKITRAYDFGAKTTDDGSFKPGAEVVKQTILHNFGFEADGVVMATFGGFQSIVDLLGPVTVDNPYDVYDPEYPTQDYGIKEVFFPAGALELDGENALIYCRTRHQDSDEGRHMRQRLVLRALLDQAKGFAGQDLYDLARANRTSYRTTFGKQRQLAFALTAPEVSNDNVAFGSISSLLWSDYASTGAWIWNGDWSVIPGYVQQFLRGEIPGIVDPAVTAP